MNLYKISDVKIGQILRFRTQKSIRDEYEGYIDHDGDIELKSGYLMNDKVVACQGCRCQVIYKSSRYIHVKFDDDWMQRNYGQYDFIIEYFETATVTSFELTCPVGTTVDNIYLSQHMKDLLSKAYDCSEHITDNITYYKISDYYFPASVINITESEV